MQALPEHADLTDQTHKALRAAIVSGELLPGSPLAQADLAQRLGVSRQPISHALKLLKHEGLVVDRGRKGQMVAPIDADRLLALYQVRGALDQLAAQLVADKTLTKPERSYLAQLIEDGSTAAGGSDMPLMVAADIAFHRFIHDVSGNSEIPTAMKSLWPHIERVMHTVLEHQPGRAPIWREHQAIADAILANDAARASKLAGQHAQLAGASNYQRLMEIQPRVNTQI
jgi:DNA-binding GntR family transcriptional regulator